MKAIVVRRFGAALTMVTLMWLSLGPVGLEGVNEAALAASDPVIAAAGDIACDPSNSSFNGGNGTSSACRQKYVSDLLVSGGYSAVLTTGDNQNYCGGYQAYVQSYGPSWGRVKSITHPSVGNHEYLTSGGTDCSSGAAGYFNYFGAAAGTPGQGYYSYDVGAWHLIVLNSNCGDAGGCSSSSPQGRWLLADLAAHNTLCTLAYFHIPLFSSGGRAASNMQWVWQTLYNNDVEVILNGHDHIYERFAPQSPSGALDEARGIRQFIVGTGGQNHTSIASIAANSVVRNTDTFGFLTLTLHDRSYDWRFVPEPGKTFSDSGSAMCFGEGQPGITSTPSRTFTPTRTFTPAPSGTVTPIATGTQGDTWPTETFTFSPVADSYVNQSSPTANYGTSTQLRVDGSPFVRSYLRFDVRNLRGRVTRALLRVYANTSLSGGYEVRPVTDIAWGETAINYNNAPPFGNAIGVSGPVIASGWNTIDVTSLITGNGLYSLALNTSSGTALSLVSREAAANQPQLVVEAQIPTPTPLPTNTPTATFTSTSTLTPSHTATATPTSTDTPTATPTDTPLPPATETVTDTPVLTETPTDTPTPTETPVPTAIDPPLDTPTSTGTPLPSDTPTATQTDTETPLPSDTPVATQTATPTPGDPPTDTPTVVQPDTETPTSSDTPVVTQTDTATPTPGDPPTDTPTVVQPDTETPIPSEPPTNTPLPTATDTETPVPTNTETSQPTATTTDMPTSQPTETATTTPVATDTPTPLPTDVPTATQTASATQAPTATRTNTPISTSTRTATASLTPTRTGTPTSSIRTFTFTPVADSYVNQSSPTANYGTSTQIRVDGSPLVRSYLRFNVQNLTGRVTRATLRIYANSATSSSCVANIVSNNTWTETGLTYNNAPPLGGALGSSGSFGAGAWITMDVTAYVTGNGTYSLAVTTPGSTAVSLASRQAGANAPQLIIETAP